MGMPGLAPTDPAEQERVSGYADAIGKKLAQGDVDGGAEAFITMVSGPGAWQGMPEASRQVLRDNAWTLLASLLDAPRWSAFGPEDARRVELPLLLVGGAKSPAKFGAVLDRAQSCLRHAERVSIPDAAHPMSRMNPSAFNSAVLAFLEGK